MRKLIKWPGGKHYIWKKHILPLVRPHKQFYSGFAGGLSDILDSPEQGKEIAFDINPDLINMWKVVQSCEAATRLLRILNNTPHCEQSFDLWVKKEPKNDIDRAAKFIIMNRLSRDGAAKAYSYSPRLRRGMPENESSWQGIKEDFWLTHHRIHDVEFRNGCFIKFLKSRKPLAADSTIYADPPYPHDTRTSKKLYEWEMTNAQHERLLTQLVKQKCQVIVSSYDNEMYNDHLRGWKKLEIPVKINMGVGKKSNRIEVVYYNS